VMAAPTRKLQIHLPDAERGRSPDVLRRFDKLTRKLARPNLTEKERRDIIEELVAIERSPAAAAEAEWRRQAISETEALAAARGEQVASEKSGVKRLLDRDPLLSLARAKALTNDQLEAGIAVRELYDLRAGDAASAPFDGMPAGRHDHEHFVAKRWLRAKTVLPIGQLETAILNGHFRTRSGILLALEAWPAMKAAGMEPHISLRVLRWVCGEHNTLTSLGQGRAYDRHRRALCWALDVAGDVLDLCGRPR
jgi:hypothetical protein